MNHDSRRPAGRGPRPSDSSLAAARPPACLIDRGSISGYRYWIPDISIEYPIHRGSVSGYRYRIPDTSRVDIGISGIQCYTRCIEGAPIHHRGVSPSGPDCDCIRHPAGRISQRFQGKPRAALRLLTRRIATICARGPSSRRGPVSVRPSSARTLWAREGCPGGVSTHLATPEPSSRPTNYKL